VLEDVMMRSDVMVVVEEKSWHTYPFFSPT